MNYAEGRNWKYYKLLKMHCRICLTDVTPLVGIFSEDGMKHQLVDKIRICLQIQIQRDDCFPDKVCCKCFMSVNEFFSFWKKARESYNLLHKLQKDVTLRQSVSWPNESTESEDIVIEPTPDLLDMIDMESTTGNRQIADILKQTGDDDYMSNFTGKNKSTYSSLPANANDAGIFLYNNPRDDTTSRYLQFCDVAFTNPTVQSIPDTITWQHLSEETPSTETPPIRSNDYHLYSKPNQFISEQFSFGRPSMNYDIPKEVQENSTNSWEIFRGEKPESKLNVGEKENKSFSSSFSFSRKCTSSEDANSSFEPKPQNLGSQSIFSSTDECSLPKIPLSLFSPSEDKKQMYLQTKKPMKNKHGESSQPQSPIIGTSEEIGFSLKPNIEMTPRSKVMKMLNREMW